MSKNKNVDYPHAALIVSSDKNPIRILKTPDANSIGLGLVPNATHCIVLNSIQNGDQHWYWIDLFGTQGYIPHNNLKIIKNKF